MTSVSRLQGIVPVIAPATRARTRAVKSSTPEPVCSRDVTNPIPNSVMAGHACLISSYAIRTAIRTDVTAAAAVSP